MCGRNSPPESDFTVIEECGDVTRQWLGDTPAGDPCNLIIARTYLITDDCGNATVHIQSFEVNDDVDPVVVCPDDVVGDGCDESAIAGISGLAYSSISVVIDELTFESLDTDADVSDNCGIREISYSDVITNPNCPLIVDRTFVVTDSCGNSISCVQEITVEDNELPTINCPDDINAEGCSPGDILSISGLAFSTDSVTITQGQFNGLNGSPSVSDNCGIKEIRYIDAVSGGGCSYTIQRTFTVVDDCNQEQHCVQEIAFTDNTDPTITCASAIDADGCTTDDILTASGLAYSTSDVQIDSATFVSVTGGTVDDNCGVDYVEYVDVMNTATCPALVEIERTFTVYDSCGLSSSCTQIIRLNDNEDPTIVCPADINSSDYCDESDLITLTGLGI